MTEDEKPIQPLHPDPNAKYPKIEGQPLHYTPPPEPKKEPIVSNDMLARLSETPIPTVKEPKPVRVFKEPNVTAPKKRGRRKKGG